MHKNPYLHAVAASAYIIGIVLLINSFGQLNIEDTILAPMVMLSLLTLSAAVMGYLFVYAPLQLYLDGKKSEAVSLFFKTVVTFAVITGALLIFMLSGIVK
jgi:hypothetical protein